MTTGKEEFEKWFAALSDDLKEKVAANGDWDKLHTEAQQAWEGVAKLFNHPVYS